MTGGRPIRTENCMRDIDGIEAHLREVSSLPETLAVSFSAFEAIRLTARAHEGQVPMLFAAFMTTADAAVTGREALTIAPSLGACSTAESGVSDPSTPVDLVTDALARLGALLDDRLAHAAALAQAPGDKTACEQAADAARQIRDLMARGHDDSHLR
jgi:hypothetical protein